MSGAANLAERTAETLRQRATNDQVTSVGLRARRHGPLYCGRANGALRFVLTIDYGPSLPPTEIITGGLIDLVFNPYLCTGSYFEDFYDARIKTMHPSSRFGIFPVAPLEADDFLFLRYGLIEVYHWLITKRVHAPA
jgi:hypothetical protein